jgi:hypothetical protein
MQEIAADQGNLAVQDEQREHPERRALVLQPKPVLGVMSHQRLLLARRQQNKRRGARQPHRLKPRGLRRKINPEPTKRARKQQQK